MLSQTNVSEKETPEEIWQKAGVPARAFLGWDSYTGTAFKSDGTIIPDETRMRYLNNFWEDWAGNLGLRAALEAANSDQNNLLGVPQQFTRLNEVIRLWGCPTLQFYQ